MAETANVQRDDAEWSPEGRPHRYTMPFVRYVNIVLGLLFIDGILSIVLWLTGGNSEYFVDNITHFHVKDSVFDLALISAAKVVLHAPTISYLETVTLQQIDEPFNQRLRTKVRLIYFITILFSLAVLAYCGLKGGLILNAILNDSDYTHMHTTYNALVISALAFALIEFGFFLYSFTAMRRLKVVRVLHLYNDEGQEVDKDGKPLKKNVNMLRLISLAKPEYPMILMATMFLFVSSSSQMVAPLFFGKVVDAALHSMETLEADVYNFNKANRADPDQMIPTGSGSTLFAQAWRGVSVLIVFSALLYVWLQVNLSMLSRYLLQMIGSLVLMFTLNPALTGVLLSVVPVVSMGAVQYGKFMKKLRQQFQDRLGDAGTQAEENLSSIRTVRTFAGEIKATNMYGIAVDKSYQVGKKLAAAGGIFEGCVGLLVYGCITLVLWYGGKLVHENSQDSSKGITPGVLTSFLLYTLQVAMAFALMSSLYGDFMQALGASVRIFDLMDRKPKVPNENGAVLPQLDGRVEFKGIDFTYPSRPETKVLKNISFTIEPGQMVALVGPSGGGKSTIVNMIERFYDPDAGIITLGGHALNDLDPAWFRQKISMVSQEPTLFACSIKENIMYGRETSLEEVTAVAKEANAHEFIMGFEEGYETLVGERGVRLSGGQKQRVAIARALIMDPVLLLLDEATSALDAESEHLVQEAIDRAMKGRTVLVIAHRLSTVRNASKVVVIDKGEIAEQGSHEELLAKNGVYKRLVLRQLTAGAITEQLIRVESDKSLENGHLLD